MTERSYQDAVQVLKDHLGGQWQGVETEGRSEMARILRDELGYDRRTADEAIDAMIQSGTLRYHRRSAEDGDNVAPPAVAPIGMGASTSGTSGVPLAPGVIADTGHWEIGAGNVVESDELGRKGQ